MLGLVNTIIKNNSLEVPYAKDDVDLAYPDSEAAHLPSSPCPGHAYGDGGH